MNAGAKYLATFYGLFPLPNPAKKTFVSLGLTKTDYLVGYDPASFERRDSCLQLFIN